LHQNLKPNFTAGFSCLEWYLKTAFCFDVEKAATVQAQDDHPWIMTFTLLTEDESKQ
jgi:hypothetical protein